MRKTPLYILGLIVAALVALGLIVLCSASGANAARLHHGNVYFFMQRQFAYLAVGIVVAALFAMFDYHKWRDNYVLTIFFYIAVIGLLWTVFLFPAINGSQRWISLGPIRLQPSELAKLATVIALGVYLDQLGWRVELFTRGAIGSAVIVGLLILPVILEPDFGSVMVILVTAGLIMLLSGVRLLHLFSVGAIGVALFVVKLLTNSNRMGRIAAFLGGDGTDNPAAYQVAMARVALQRGGLLGVGYMQSMQKHGYLPEAHTDFIFAVGAEEFGIAFTIVVLVLFILFFILSLYIAHHAADRFGRFLAYGMAFIIFFQATFNLGVVCEALPTKGMALPFFSYGGTNLVSAFMAVGIILSVGIHSVKDVKRRVKRSSRV